MPQLGKGEVVTARGTVLDFDGLADAAKRPIGFKNEKSELERRPARPETAKKQIMIRGFVPGMGESKSPDLATVERKATPDKAPEAKLNQKRPIGRGGPQTLAEMTQVVVDEPRHIKVAEGEKIKPGDGIKASEQALNDIMGELDKNSDKVIKAAEKAADEKELEPEDAESKASRRGKNSSS